MPKITKLMTKTKVNSKVVVGVIIAAIAIGAGYASLNLLPATLKLTKAVLLVEPLKQDVGAASGSFQLIVSNVGTGNMNMKWQITIPDIAVTEQAPCGSWLAASPSFGTIRGTGKTTVVVSYKENVSSDSRSCQFMVSAAQTQNSPQYITVNQAASLISKCSDGTPFGQCSLTKPKYCGSGQLVDRCSLCGCPADKQSCQDDGTCQAVETEAYFQFYYPPGPETFIFKLTDPVKIQNARDILAGKIQDAIHVVGYIRKEAATYNPPWGYHLDPSTIVFFEIAAEVCDAGIQYVQDHLEEACGSFLPNCQWCPWGSELIKEVEF